MMDKNQFTLNLKLFNKEHKDFKTLIASLQVNLKKSDKDSDKYTVIAAHLREIKKKLQDMYGYADYCLNSL